MAGNPAARRHRAGLAAGLLTDAGRHGRSLWSATDMTVRMDMTTRPPCTQSLTFDRAPSLHALKTHMTSPPCGPRVHTPGSAAA